MLSSVDLFTGVGGFSLALKGIAKPLLYCDVSSDVRDTLSHLMKKGKLPTAPIVDDVKNMESIVKAVRGRNVDIITAGFPCIGFSKSGNMEGFKNAQSGLFWDTIKVVKKLRPKMVFLENVAEIVNSRDGKDLQTIVAEFQKNGFECEWVIRSAQSVGAPQVRRRWFCLAVSGNKPVIKLKESYFDWSLESMPRLVSIRDVDFARRYSMLGNAIVPAAARAAFIQLYTSEAISKVKTFPDIVLDPRHFTAYKEGDHARRLKMTLFPTPRAQMWRRSYTLTARTSRDLPTFVLFVKNIGGVAMERPESDMVVNIAFVEWLMGYPRGWTSGP